MTPKNRPIRGVLAQLDIWNCKNGRAGGLDAVKRLRHTNQRFFLSVISSGGSEWHRNGQDNIP